MAFKVRGSLNPHGAPVLKRVVITNSEATVIGSSMKVASGFLTAGTKGALVFGHLFGHITNEGIGMNTTGVAGAAMGSYVNTFTPTSTNQTVAKVKGICDISKSTLYGADTDAAIGSTTGSNLIGYYIDLEDTTQLDESGTTTATMQYTTWGVDPEDTGNALVNIYESAVFGV